MCTGDQLPVFLMQSQVLFAKFEPPAIVVSHRQKVKFLAAKRKPNTFAPGEASFFFLHRRKTSSISFNVKRADARKPETMQFILEFSIKQAYPAHGRQTATQRDPPGKILP